MFKSDITTHGVCVPHPAYQHELDAAGHPVPDVLHVVIPYSNYSSFDSRLSLHRICIEHLGKLPGIKIWLVEVALDNRQFLVTKPGNPQHIQLRTKDMIWHKENMINVAIRHMTTTCPNWKYVAWVDGDIRFDNQHVAYKTIHQLQSYAVVQMFSSVANLGPQGQIYDTHHGFCYQYAKAGYKYPENAKYEIWHPGFAWACTRQAYVDMGGLIDWAVLGSADHHMILALVGNVMASVHGKISRAYVRRLMQFQERVMRTIKGNIGYVEGLIIHGWHGKFSNRKYIQRWEILVECEFDPDTDIKYDEHGLLAFDNPKPRLRDLIRFYFESRDEDSVAMD